MLPDERHPGVIEEVLDVHPPLGGEVVGDDDVVVFCQVRPAAGQAGAEPHLQGWSR